MLFHMKMRTIQSRYIRPSLTKDFSISILILTLILMNPPVLFPRRVPRGIPMLTELWILPY
jgi:hypothetical protein